MSQSPPPAAIVRGLLRAAGRATLATTLAGPSGDGWPYASLVLLAVDHDASPLLLISTLAEHTRNLAAERTTIVLIDDLHFAPDEGRVVTADPPPRAVAMSQTRAEFPAVMEVWSLP